MFKAALCWFDSTVMSVHNTVSTYSRQSFWNVIGLLDTCIEKYLNLMKWLVSISCVRRHQHNLSTRALQLHSVYPHSTNLYILTSLDGVNNSSRARVSCLMGCFFHVHGSITWSSLDDSQVHSILNVDSCGGDYVTFIWITDSFLWASPKCCSFI